MNQKELTVQDAADVLEDISVFQELNKENPFKVKAFANAARILKAMSGTLADLLAAGTLKKTKGIGPGTLERIEELHRLSYSPYLEDLKKQIPSGLVVMMQIPGLGPKKVRAIYDALKIDSLESLEGACRDGRIAELKGFSEKSAQNILKGIAFSQTHADRILYSDALPQAQDLFVALKRCSAIQSLELGGSLRRHLETIKDIDLVAASTHAQDVMDFFLQLPQVAEITNQGDTKSAVVLQSGMRADLRVVTPEQFPYALLHFSGSKEHNTALRSRAKEFGFKLNEYGLFEGDKNIACASEADIYKRLGLHFIPPELREDRGEIAQAEKDDFHALVTLKDIQGTFHAHTQWSDGRNSLEEMVSAARAMGLKYFGITDHSQSAVYANGLRPDRIKKQREEMNKVQEKFPDILLLHGIESDILKDGALDYPESVLREFDFIIASVHGNFNLSENEMTQRLIRAIENPFTTMIGHLTGRLLLAREGFQLNMEAVIEAAARHQVVIEINANPRRFDLDWRWGNLARKHGLKTSINPDAHETSGFQFIEMGVGIARKAGFRKTDVINTLSPEKIQAFLRKKVF